MIKNLLLTATLVGVISSSASAEIDAKAFGAALKNGEAHEVVTKFVSEDPEDVVAYVKQSIIETEASASSVAEIVRAAIIQVPEKARVIYVAALAVAPDAHDEVLKVYYEHTANKGVGVSDAKGADVSKGGKTQVGPAQKPAPVYSVLDFPFGDFGNIVAGPTRGGQGGFPLLGVLEQPDTTFLGAVDEVSAF